MYVCRYKLNMVITIKRFTRLGFLPMKGYYHSGKPFRIVGWMDIYHIVII